MKYINFFLPRVKDASKNVGITCPQERVCYKMTEYAIDIDIVCI